jgi:hypothetical protein
MNTAPALAQGPSAPPVTIGDVSVSGLVRTRLYSWDWFGTDPRGQYSYPATLARVDLFQSHPGNEWHVEVALPLVLGLPRGAVGAAPQGQLGLGAAYYAANGDSENAAVLFLKRGFFEWKAIGGVPGQSLSVGRFEFNDGSEVIPADANLAVLKRDRISQRLLGNFGFSDIGRSIDGALYSLTASDLNLTALAGRPTQGVFDVNGWPELKINVFYTALTRQISGDGHPVEWALFGLGYDDYRRGVIKADNRPPTTVRRLSAAPTPTRSPSVPSAGTTCRWLAQRPDRLICSPGVRRKSDRGVSRRSAPVRSPLRLAGSRWPLNG